MPGENSDNQQINSQEHSHDHALKVMSETDKKVVYTEALNDSFVKRVLVEWRKIDDKIPQIHISQQFCTTLQQIIMETCSKMWKHDCAKANDVLRLIPMFDKKEDKLAMHVCLLACLLNENEKYSNAIQIAQNPNNLFVMSFNKIMRDKQCDIERRKDMKKWIGPTEKEIDSLTKIIKSMEEEIKPDRDSLLAFQKKYGDKIRSYNDIIRDDHPAEIRLHLERKKADVLKKFKEVSQLLDLHNEIAQHYDILVRKTEALARLKYETSAPMIASLQAELGSIQMLAKGINVVNDEHTDYVRAFTTDECELPAQNTKSMALSPLARIRNSRVKFSLPALENTVRYEA